MFAPRRGAMDRRGAGDRQRRGPLVARLQRQRRRRRADRRAAAHGAERTRLFLFHKPRGLVTTAKDPEGRSTIFDALPEELPRVVAIGRLDINTEGLLLLTNDGGLSRVLELPSTGWLRRYRVRAHGEITQEQLDGLRDGVTIDGVDYLGIEAKFERQQGSNVWLTMGSARGQEPRDQARAGAHGDERQPAHPRLFRPVRTRRPRRGRSGRGAHAGAARPTRAEARQAGRRQFRSGRGGAGAAAAKRRRGGDQPLRRKRDDKSSEGPPRKRKHVSVLRAEAREEAAGPRKRISRATTADRKGREIKVEMVSLAKRPEPEPTRERRAPPRRSASGGFEKREGRRRAQRRRSPPASRSGRRFSEAGARASRGRRRAQQLRAASCSWRGVREARAPAPRGRRRRAQRLRPSAASRSRRRVREARTRASRGRRRRAQQLRPPSASRSRRGV